MATNYQAFFHGSDACVIDDIGKRYTWMKLASPRIEALRQAFIASDSRIRIAYEKDGKEELVPIPNPPDIAANRRPWLKCVEANGSASFFGATGPGKAKKRFELSPDLTCIIGGSMTGKSTFLDGLRVYIGAPLPQDRNLNEQVRARGEQRFLLWSRWVSWNSAGAGGPSCAAPCASSMEPNPRSSPRPRTSE